jgi:microcystin degradation protein MlrC/GNAT superfamily N-acetyltransferase
MPKIALFRFWYEGNSFSPLPARASDFLTRESFSGVAAAAFYEGKALEPGGALGVARANPGTELVFLDCTAAYPSGPIEAGFFPEYHQKLIESLRGQSWDGVYASLHGAAVCEDWEQPELQLLRSVRSVIGEAPLAVSFDLHANLNPEVGRLAEIVLGYKTHPHVDMAETGAKAMTLLLRTLRGEIAPRSLVLPADFVPTSFNMRTDAGPMAEMAALAAETCDQSGFLDVTVFGGFACADSPDTGAALSLCGEAPLPGLLEAAQALRVQYRERAEAFEETLPLPSDALARFRKGELRKPAAFLEPSDNVFSGGAGDTPGLLSALLEKPPQESCLFAFFWDPSVVEQAFAAGEGGALSCRLGGRLSPHFGAPVEVEVRVLSLAEGSFVNEGPMERGLRVEMGRAAVLRCGRIDILVTSRNIPVNDPAYFTFFGLSLADYPLLCVKAKNHFRAAFAGSFATMLALETPGPAPSDLLRLPFEKVPEARLRFGRADSPPQPTIREAQPEDAAAIARLHAESWRSVYQGILEAHYLTHRLDEERAAFWETFLRQDSKETTVLLAEREGSLLGFIALVRDGEAGYDAVIENLHVSPNARGGGAGRLLLAEACRRLRAQGGRSVCLWVFDSNAAAFAFYKRLGGLVDGHISDSDAPPSEADSRIGWRDLDELIRLCEGT